MYACVTQARKSQIPPCQAPSVPSLSPYPQAPSSPLLSSVLRAGERQRSRWLLLTLCLCQFSFILERLNILETSFSPSNGAEGGHGFKRDPSGPGRHEPWESRLPWRCKEGERRLGNSHLDQEAMIKLMQSANRITFLKRKWKMKKTLSFSVLYCKTWYRFIDNKISHVKEHLRVGDVAYQR